MLTIFPCKYFFLTSYKTSEIMSSMSVPRANQSCPARTDKELIVRVSKLSCMHVAKKTDLFLWTHMWRNRMMMVKGAESREAAKVT